MPMLAVWLTCWPAKSMGSTDDLEDAVGGGEHLHLAVGLVDQDHELVAAQAGREVIAPDAGADPVGDGGQDPVAAGVAEEVVHDLEAVEVEEEDGRLAVGRQADLPTLASRARRLGRPVRSSWRAMYAVRSSASMRAWSWTSMEATACSALISAGVQAWQAEVEEPEDAPGRVGQQERHGGTVDDQPRPNPPRRAPGTRRAFPARRAGRARAGPWSP